MTEVSQEAREVAEAYATDQRMGFLHDGHPLVQAFTQFQSTITARVRAETLEQATKHLLDMAKAYKLGTPESGAIITATESMRVAIRALGEQP